MYENNLKKELSQLAHSHGNNTHELIYLHPDVSAVSAVLFKEIFFNFQKDSWLQIQKEQRLSKSN